MYFVVFDGSRRKTIFSTCLGNGVMAFNGVPNGGMGMMNFRWNLFPYLFTSSCCPFQSCYDTKQSNAGADCWSWLGTDERRDFSQKILDSKAACQTKRKHRCMPCPTRVFSQPLAFFTCCLFGFQNEERVGRRPSMRPSSSRRTEYIE